MQPATSRRPVTHVNVVWVQIDMFSELREVLQEGVNVDLLKRVHHFHSDADEHVASNAITYLDGEIICEAV